MKVKIKRLNELAEIPQYAKSGDACIDLVATSFEIKKHIITYNTGLAIEIPEGYVGLLFPRSSVSKKSLILCNHVGVIDSGYRGEIMLKFRALDLNNIYGIGDRVAQLMILPYPKIELVDSDELSSTERGEGGFGSTGK